MKAVSALTALAVLFGACFGGDGPPDATSRVTDAVGDVARGPAADAPQPPGIDLATAELTRADGTLSFTATVADPGDERTRVWVVRLRETDGTLLAMLYASDSNVLLCDHDRFCTERVEDATIAQSASSVEVRLPLPKLPDSFEWEASASSSSTPNIDDTWNDFAPKATLSG
ncbi:MAG TPA: hypothetical protein VM938_12930 [Acidimicrobiales bacterium]|nr:hypothetical protein [Acidimicrobiales bacterium]